MKNQNKNPNEAKHIEMSTKIKKRTQIETTSLIVSLCLGSGPMHSWITSQMTSSSLFLKDWSVGSINQVADAPLVI